MRSYRPIATALVICFPAVHACAQPADFYAGKTISLIIGSGEAGGYDMGGRLMARYLRKYIPGTPAIIPRNMPGASSVVAAEYAYNVAPRDGLTLATTQPTIVLNKSLDSSAKYQPENFTWIGRVQPVTLIGVGWTASGLNTIDDARKREFAVSASGAAGLAAIVPWALNRMAGTKFKVIRGYESVRPQFTAMERGEVMGIGSVSLPDILARPDWLRDKIMSLIYTISLKRAARAPDSPAIAEFAANDLDRKVLTMLGASGDVGQMLMAPPDVPAARAAILRKAFDAMAADPEFIEDAKRVGIFVEPLDGPALTALVAGASGVSPETLARLRDVSKPPD